MDPADLSLASSSVWWGRYPALDVLLLKMTPSQLAEFDRVVEQWSGFRFENREAKAFLKISSRITNTSLYPAYLDFEAWVYFLIESNRKSEITAAYNAAVASGLDVNLLRELVGLLDNNFYVYGVP